MKKWSALVAAMTLTVAMPGLLVAHDHFGAPPAEFTATESDGPAYPVSGIRLEVSSSTPDAPALADLKEFVVSLGQVSDGFVGPGGSVPMTAVPLASAPYVNYYASALTAIRTQITAHLKLKGFDGVIVYPLEQEIDPETGRDLRGVGQVGLTLLVRAEPKKRRFWFF